MWSQNVSGATIPENDPEQWMTEQEYSKVSGDDVPGGLTNEAFVDHGLTFPYNSEHASSVSNSTSVEFDTSFNLPNSSSEECPVSYATHPGSQCVAPGQTQWCYPGTDSPHLTATSSPTNDTASLATTDAQVSVLPLYQLPGAYVSNVDPNWYSDWINSDTSLVTISPSTRVSMPAQPVSQTQPATTAYSYVSSDPAPATKMTSQLSRSSFVLPSSTVDESRNHQDFVSCERTGKKAEQNDNGAGPGRSHAYYAMKQSHDGLFHCPFRTNANPKLVCQHEPTKLKCNYDKYIDSHLKPYRCKQKGCELLQFSSTACRLRHEREAHGSHGHGDKPYRCIFPDCDRSRPDRGFPRQWNRRDHMKRVHEYDELNDATVAEVSSNSGSSLRSKDLDVAANPPVAAQSRKRAASDAASNNGHSTKQRKVAHQQLSVTKSEPAVDRVKQEANAGHVYQSPHQVPTEGWAFADSTEQFRERLLHLAMTIKGPEDVPNICQEVNNWSNYTHPTHH